MQKRPEWPEPIAVLGYGVEGRSTLRHLQAWGYRRIEILDRAPPPPDAPAGIPFRSGVDYLRGLAGVQTAFRSPGIRPFGPEFEAFHARGGVLTSQVEAVFSLAGRQRIIGVTGTLGKGTCCSLLSAMLERAGIAHRLAGNIGVPPLDAWETGRAEERLLLELSSFQLSTLQPSPAGAVVLKTTSEHLDWHTSQVEYWEHKAHLTRHQRPGDWCVFYADAEGSAWIGAQGEGHKIPVGRDGTMRLRAEGIHSAEFGFDLRLEETRLLGAFNLENLAAAAAAALTLGASPQAVRTAAQKFTPLEHRLEFVATVQGVAYYNDSYATRPEAAIAAVHALRGAPLGLILGGSEKHADFGELAAALAGEPDLCAVALLGQTAERLEVELSQAGALAGRASRRCASLPEAMDFLRREIRSGAILLSPACASFGLFANYKERGKAFKNLVAGLGSQA